MCVRVYLPFSGANVENVMSSLYRKYEWSAFTEADLLKNGRNGCDFGKGDSFVAGPATTKMATYDNDARLSGASTWWCNTYADDTAGQNGYVNGRQAGCRMYAEQYHALRGSDGKTYYLIEIRIEGHDSAGAGNGYFTYYGAQPPAGTALTVTGTFRADGGWIDYSCLGAGDTAPPNTAPAFTNVPANGVFCVSENTRLVVDLNASDKNGDALSFSIVGGADGAAFAIDPRTGELSFKAAPDHERPADADGNNSYKVIVAVSDGKGGTVSKELTVAVSDVKEDAPKCTVIEAEDMKLSCYTVRSATSASGGEYIALAGAGGSASTTFAGAAGSYDLSLRYWDTAGDGTIRVYVNGKLVDTVRLNANNNAWHDITLEGLGLKKGDVITLKGDGKGCENAILDKVRICPSEPEVKPGALEGRVFADADRNGIDNAEAGVAGVVVQLLNAAGAVVATAVTAADGSYAFAGLTPGDYRVAFPTEVAGRVLTGADLGGNDTADSDASTVTGQTGSYTVVAGGVVRDVDAGVVDPGSAAIEGRVFADADGNAVDNDEAGVAGVIVTLLNAAGAVIATAVTAADGSYLFEGLDAGDYAVEFPKTANGLVLVDADAGGDDAIDSDAAVATGRTGTVSLGIGEISSDNDAGLADPATASIGNLVFLDADKNGIQDGAEGGVAGVAVTLYDAAGAAVAITTTNAAGGYLFGGLKAGTYVVGFAEKAGHDFTLANAGNDAADSDANGATGLTAPIALAIGEANLTIDAGLVVENAAPDARDDAAGTCATIARTVDVLANDADANGDGLFIAQVDGRAIAEGGTVEVDGVSVSLVGGKLVIDGSEAFKDLPVGQKARLDIGYAVSDGRGGVDTATLDMEFCGARNTLDTIKAGLPAGGTLVLSIDDVFDGEHFNVALSGTGDNRFDGQTFGTAYCVSAYLPISEGVAVPYNVYLADASVPAGLVSRPQNLDMVNWILNQDFDATDNGDGKGQAYTEAEIQGAIWGLTDNIVFVNSALGSTANAREIYNLALAHGEGFEAGEGDIVGLILDPTAAAEAAGNRQPIIIGIEWDDLAQDCFCF